MEKAELQNIIKETIISNADDSGWANLAKIGAFLRRKEVSYGRLSKMLKSHQDIVELKIDDSINPPVAYAKVINNK